MKEIHWININPIENEKPLFFKKVLILKSKTKNTK